MIGLIEGILMFRCAKDGRHSTLLIIFAVISLVLGFANSSVSFSNWSWSGFVVEVISAGLDFLVIGAALQLRKPDSLRAGK